MDTKSPEERSLNMSKIRSNKTKPEFFVRSILHKHGLRFRVNYANIAGKPDLYFPRKKVAIFVHGCFWHHHKGCKYANIPKSNTEYWTTKMKRNQERDEFVLNTLRGLDIRVIIIWECTVKKIKKNLLLRQETIQQIIDFLESSQKEFLEL